MTAPVTPVTPNGGCYKLEVFNGSGATVTIGYVGLNGSNTTGTVPDDGHTHTFDTSSNDVSTVMDLDSNQNWNDNSQLVIVSLEPCTVPVTPVTPVTPACPVPAGRIRDSLTFINGLETFSYEPNNTAANFYMSPDRKAQIDRGAAVGFTKVTIPITNAWLGSDSNFDFAQIKVMLDYIVSKYPNKGLIFNLDANMIRNTFPNGYDEWADVPVAERTVGHNGSEIANFPSMASDWHRSFQTTRLTPLYQWLQSNYSSQIYAFNLWRVGSTGEVYYPYNGFASQVDISQRMVEKYRTWLTGKYGTTLPSAYLVHTSNTTSAAATFNFIDNSNPQFAVGMTMNGKGIVGKDWGDFLGFIIVEYVKFHKALIKSVFPSIPFAAFVGGFYENQERNWAFVSTAIYDLFDICDIAYHTDGVEGWAGAPFQSSSFADYSKSYEKFMPADVIRGTWGWGKKQWIQIDPPDINLDHTNRCGTKGNVNVASTAAMLANAARRGATDISTAMFFEAGSPCDLYDKLGDIIVATKNLLGNETYEDIYCGSSTIPSYDAVIGDSIYGYGGTPKSAIHSVWSGNGGVSSIIDINLVKPNNLRLLGSGGGGGGGGALKSYAIEFSYSHNTSHLTLAVANDGNNNPVLTNSAPHTYLNNRYWVNGWSDGQPLAKKLKVNQIYQITLRSINSAGEEWWKAFASLNGGVAVGHKVSNVIVKIIEI